MNIKDEYIEKTKKYLEVLNAKLNRKSILQKEIKILLSRQKLSGGIDFEHELGIKSNPGTKGIDDLIITTDAQITCKSAQIERIEYELALNDVYFNELTDIEEDIIRLRYLDKGCNSFRNISKTIRYSKSHVKSLHDGAICKLAYYIYGENAVYE